MPTERIDQRLRTAERDAANVILEIRPDDPADAGEGVPYLHLTDAGACQLRVRVNGVIRYAALTVIGIV